MPKNAANAEVVDKGCPSVTFNYYVLTLYGTSYNLLKMLMNYNLINLQAFKELPKVIRRLRIVYENYEHFSAASTEIIVDLAITVVNAAADIILPDEELIGVGDYVCRRALKGGITRDKLLDFIQVVNIVRIKIERDNYDLLQD